MSTKNGKPFQDPRNINLKGCSLGSGLIRWDPSGSLWASNPFSTDDYGLYLNSSGKLVFSALGSTTVIGSGGGGGIPSWDDIFAADKTFNPNGTTWTINDGSASTNDILTIVNAGTGSAIQVTNSSTGADITGTSSTWSVSAAGLATFTEVDTPIVYSAASMILSCAGAGVVTIGANSNTITLAKAVTFSSTLTVSDAKTSLTSTSNTANTLLVTNNTITSYGSGGAGEGMVVFTSTSLTTGDLLRLQTDASLTSGSGNYLSCYDTGLSAEVFTISELGLTTLAGAAYGTAVLVLTLGDLSMADGRITHVAPSLTTGYGYSLTTTGLTTGTGMLLAHTTSVIADGGSVLRLTSSGINTGGATNGTMLDISTSAQLAGTMIKVGTIQTTGTVMSVVSTGIMTTTGNLLTLTANSATTAAGLLRINANALTSGIAAVITSSATAITGAGRLLYVNHTGATGSSATLSEFASAANDETVIMKITASDILAAGTALSVSVAAMTTGTAIGIGTLAALTTGIGLSIASSATAITGAGRLLYVNHTGTGGSTATLSEFASAATDETVILKVTASGANALGKALFVSTAVTTGNGIQVTANALTDGFGLTVDSSSTALTSTGRLFLVNHSGATGTSAVVSEIKSAANDETVIFQLLASDVLAAGKIMNISGAAMTTGTALSIANLNALTTGTGISVISNSADTTARNLVYIKNDHASAVGAIPLTIANDAVTGTGSKFIAVMKLGGTTIWQSIDQTTPNAALTATAGDICLNGPSSVPFYCTGTNVWVALA